MSKEKAIALLSLLGDNAENVLELLPEDHAQFLRDNKRTKDSFNPLELEDVVSSAIEHMTQVDELPSTLESVAEDLDLDIGNDSDEQLEESLEKDIFVEEEIKEDVSDLLDLEDDETEDSHSLDAFDSLDVDELGGDSLEEDVDASMDQSSVEIDALDAPQDYRKIANVLKEQNPQLVAFFLKKLAQDKRDHIMTFLPEEFGVQLASISVEELPISDKIFEELYNELFGDWN